MVTGAPSRIVVTDVAPSVAGRRHPGEARRGRARRRARHRRRRRPRRALGRAVAPAARRQGVGRRPDGLRQPRPRPVGRPLHPVREGRAPVQGAGLDRPLRLARPRHDAQGGGRPRRRLRAPRRPRRCSTTPPPARRATTRRSCRPPRPGCGPATPSTSPTPARPSVRRRPSCTAAASGAPTRPRARSSRCSSSASGPRSAPGTSCSPARRSAATAVPTRRRRPRHPARRHRPPRLRRRPRLRHPLPAADPPDRPRVPQGPRQRDRRPGPTTPAARGRSAAPEGGHTAVHPELGTVDDVRDARRPRRASNGIEVALDLAFQCSPDHPWVTEHPEWFRHRPDGTIQYAENPPKKYQDIYPLDFETRRLARRCGRRCLDVVAFWMDQGVTRLPGRQPPHQAVRRSGSG